MYKFMLRTRQGFAGVSQICGSSDSPGEEKVMVSVKAGVLVSQPSRLHLVSVRPGHNFNVQSPEVLSVGLMPKNCNICCKVLSQMGRKRKLPCLVFCSHSGTRLFRKQALVKPQHSSPHLCSQAFGVHRTPRSVIPTPARGVCSRSRAVGRFCSWTGR